MPGGSQSPTSTEGSPMFDLTGHVDLTDHLLLAAAVLAAHVLMFALLWFTVWRSATTTGPQASAHGIDTENLVLLRGES